MIDVLIKCICPAHFSINLFLFDGLILWCFGPRQNVIRAKQDSISYVGNLTRGMTPAVRVWAFWTQNIRPFAAFITEMPRADPLATNINITTKTALVVALWTASLVTHQKLATITTNKAIVFMDWNENTNRLRLHFLWLTYG